MKKHLLIIALFLLFNISSLAMNIKKQEDLNKKENIQSNINRCIIVLLSGDKICDIYKLKNTSISILENGVLFKNPKTNTEVIIIGNIKILNNPTDNEWNEYVEYHYDEEFCNEIR